MLLSTRLTPVRCFVEGDPAVARLEMVEPELRQRIDELVDALPIPPTVAAFSADSFCRPPTSSRCFYFLLRVDDDGGAGAGGGVIAFKGLEPCAADFSDLLADFRRAGPTAHNIAKHFVYEERKVPGCLTLDNALFEAER